MNVLGLEDRRHRSDLVLKPLDFRDGLQCPLNVSANACSCPNWMDAEFSYGDNSSFFQNSHLSPVRSCSVLLILVLADQSILPVRRLLAQPVRLFVLLGLVNVQFHQLDSCLFYNPENFL